MEDYTEEETIQVILLDDEFCNAVDVSIHQAVTEAWGLSNGGLCSTPLRYKRSASQKGKAQLMLIWGLLTA